MRIPILVKMCALCFVGVIGVLLLTTPGSAQDNPQQLALQVDVIAKALRDGKMKVVTEHVKKIARQEGEVYNIHLLFKPRNKKGFGVGKIGEKIVPDGIELRIRVLARDGIIKERLNAEAGALVEMAYRTAAGALLTEQLPPKAANWRPFWKNSSQYMVQTSMDLIDAVNKRNAADVKKYAGELNLSCNNCHAMFRPGGGPIMLPVRPAKGKK